MLVAENSSYIITRFILDRAPEFTQQMHQTEDGKNYGVFLLCVRKCVQGRRRMYRVVAFSPLSFVCLFLIRLDICNNGFC